MGTEQAGRSREELIDEIRAIYEELKNLGVFTGRFYPGNWSLEKLREEAELRRDQLVARKKFMGVK